MKLPAPFAIALAKCCLASFAALLLFGEPAFAQQSVVLNLNMQSALAGKVGSVAVNGQSFGTGTPLSPQSSNPGVAVVGAFHTATLALDTAGVLKAICPADQSQYTDMVETPDDAQVAAQFLQAFTTRTALLEVQFGTYSIVFAKLTGPDIDPLVRNYALKSVNGAMCMTFELRGDPTFNTVVDLITASLGG
jgi:hypothetical protein